MAFVLTRAGLSIDHVNLREKERFMSGEKVGALRAPCVVAVCGLRGEGLLIDWLEDHQLCIGVCAVLVCVPE